MGTAPAVARRQGDAARSIQLGQQGADQNRLADLVAENANLALAGRASRDVEADLVAHERLVHCGERAGDVGSGHRLLDSEGYVAAKKGLYIVVQ